MFTQTRKEVTIVSIKKSNSLSYVVNSDAKRIIIASDFYVPFELPKSNNEVRKKVIDLRQEIKTSLEKLIVEEDEILLASYSETDKNRFYDVENMLFYNIGTSSFLDCCKSQIAFIGDEQRFCEKIETPTDLSSQYFYDYKIVKTTQVNDLINSKNVIAYWEGINIDLNIPQSAKRYYSAIRKNAEDIEFEQNLNINFKLFGIKIDVIMPNKNLPASIMKPLLDGVICAFHGEQGKTQETLNRIFGEETGEKYGNNDKLNIFGERQYVDIYRGANSYKWNPEDERLQFAWITVSKGEKATMSGKIFQW